MREIETDLLTFTTLAAATARVTRRLRVSKKQQGEEHAQGSRDCGGAKRKKNKNENIGPIGRRLRRRDQKAQRVGIEV